MTTSDEAPGGTAQPEDSAPALAVDPHTAPVTASGTPENPGPAADAEDEPDIGFSLAPQPPEPDITERARTLMHQVARELAAAGPEGWQRVDAVFASTVTADVGFAIFSDGAQRAVRWTPTPQVLTLIREHRQLSAQLGDGPWWRLLLALTATGEIEVDYDYGDEPFPDDQLFAPEIYRADLEAFPRKTLPVWLAAYLFHADRQVRTPGRAAAQARADREAGRTAAPVAGLPDFPVLAARWAVLSAAFVAARSEWGPRLTPGVRWFEGASRSGCTLASLPRGRAVLSGGVWNAPELDAVYNHEAPMPELFRGAPEWVSGPVLNHRANTGQLTFCYWWDGESWYRGDSPDVAGLAGAVPGVWDAATVARIITGVLVDAAPDEERRAAVEKFVAAAESATVTRADLTALFPEPDGFDIDGAFAQLELGGVTAPEPLTEQQALSLVRRRLDADTPEYPLEKLRADRVAGGWMVYVPVEPGEIAIGRAIFYLADDGVLERSSSSIAPSLYLPDFARRFRERNRALL